MNFSTVLSHCFPIVFVRSEGGFDKPSDCCKLWIRKIKDENLDVGFGNYMTRKILYGKVETSRFQLPVIGGDPITLEAALELREVVFGKPNLGSTLNGLQMELLHGTTGFLFREPESELSFGFHSIFDKQPIIKSVFCAVQAGVIRSLIFEMKNRWHAATPIAIGASSSFPNEAKQADALAIAISDIIWKAGEKRQAVVVLPHTSSYIPKTNRYEADGFTEKLQIFELDNYEDVRSLIKRYIGLFRRERGHAIIILIYSVVLSRGIKRVWEDLGASKTRQKQSVPSLLAPTRFLTRPTKKYGVSIPLLMLLMTGKASPFLHNGIVYIGDEENCSVPKVGIVGRSPIGFLLLRSGTEAKQKRHHTAICDSEIPPPDFLPNAPSLRFNPFPGEEPPTVKTHSTRNEIRNADVDWREAIQLGDEDQNDINFEDDSFNVVKEGENGDIENSEEIKNCDITDGDITHLTDVTDLTDNLSSHTLPDDCQVSTKTENILLNLVQLVQDEGNDGETQIITEECQETNVPVAASQELPGRIYQPSETTESPTDLEEAQDGLSSDSGDSGIQDPSEIPPSPPELPKKNVFLNGLNLGLLKKKMDPKESAEPEEWKDKAEVIEEVVLFKEEEKEDECLDDGEVLSGDDKLIEKFLEDLLEPGSRLKTPHYPIWITMAEEKMGVLYHNSLDLLRDYHAEYKFDLQYYSANVELDEPVYLTINTRQKVEEKVEESPVLERLIRTKWDGAHIIWNDVEPIL